MILGLSENRFENNCKQLLLAEINLGSRF